MLEQRRWKKKTHSPTNTVDEEDMAGYFGPSNI
jgi:hypothetical protein